MKLNKYQRCWIKKLKSGTTRKAVGSLVQVGGAKCCLGVAINELGLDKLNLVMCALVADIDPEIFPYTAEKLKLKTPSGHYDRHLIKGKYSNDERVMRVGTLIQLNDNTNMTHKEIGEFIDDNRELIFAD